MPRFYCLPGGLQMTSELSRQLVRRGMGVAFQTRIGVEADRHSGLLPLNDNSGVFSDLGVYVRNGRYLPVAVDAFVRTRGEEIAQLERTEAQEVEAQRG